MPLLQQQNETGVGQKVRKMNHQQGNQYLDPYHMHGTMQAKVHADRPAEV